MREHSNVVRGVKGVVFDLDGTLVTSELDFDRLRAEAGVPPGVPVLEYLETAGPQERRRVRAVLLAHERRAAERCDLLPGVRQVLEHLRRLGLKLALLTRNSRASVCRVLERFGIEFDCAVAREDARPKPSPEPVLKIAASLGLHPRELLVVGDYVFDVQAGRAAGARTALVHADGQLAETAGADLVLRDLSELLHCFGPLEPS